jgi:type IV secretory pathway ATPase VirB11/archaellum biosynthesis ATPase
MKVKIQMSPKIFQVILQWSTFLEFYYQKSNNTVLLIFRNGKTSDSTITYTKTTKENMKSLAYAVSLGNTILLEGTTGSGKTILVEELSKITGNTGLIHSILMIRHY